MADTESPVQESGSQPVYIAPELVSCRNNGPKTSYSCYLMELKQYSFKKTQLQNIILAFRTRLESDDEKLSFDLNVDGSRWASQLSYVGDVNLSVDETLRCQRFQVTLLRVLLDHNLDRLGDALERLVPLDDSAVVDYLILPSVGPTDDPLIDWDVIGSVLFPYENPENKHSDSCPREGCIQMHTKNGLLFSCLVKNSLVFVPHNAVLYCVNGILDNLDGRSVLKSGKKEPVTYKDYYMKKYGIELCSETEPFLYAKHIPKVHNYLHRCERQKPRESTNASVELPPQVCVVIMSPMPISTFYTFLCIPSMICRVESLLLASCLKKICTNHVQNVKIPTLKILEAITTSMCQEDFDLESLETLGDSFLKYTCSQQVFKTYQNDQEGALTAKREKMVCNSQLYKLACERNIPGFIRNEQFDPKEWIIPSDYSKDNNLDEDCVLSRGKIYSSGRQNIKNEVIADVTEALVGAFLSTAGEKGALSFMKWLGLDIGFINAPIVRNFPLNAEELVNTKDLQSLLNYTFRDPSLLVEALTHGSYTKAPRIRSYQRLEFLGDAVLDYAITRHMYYKYPGLSPGEITELRSESVNNSCYALSSVKAGLHKHILSSCNVFLGQIAEAAEDFKQLSSTSTFGWEIETSFPKALADIIESIAGAVFLDSGSNAETVFDKIRPLLEPMVTLESLRSHPVKELNELCQKRKYNMKLPVEVHKDGETQITLEVEANGDVYSATSSARSKKTAMRLACKNILKLLKSEAGA